ncbi:MAG: aspartyl protease family protein [Planctomycetota bacterium]|jgi:hypothetical protein
MMETTLTLSGKAGRRVGGRRLTTVTVLASVCSLAVAEPSAITPQDVRRHVRDAMGMQAQATNTRGLLVRADTRYYDDLQGTATTWLGPNGSFLTRIAGPVSSSVGFDGSRGHAVDISGIAYELALEGLDLQKLIHWVRGGYWVDDAAPLAVSIDTQRSNEKNVALKVAFPKDRLEALVFVDRGTWLPVAIHRKLPGRDHEWTLGDYRTVGGVTLAHEVIYKDAEGNVFEDRIRSIELLSAAAPDRFGQFARRPDDTRFDSSVLAAVETKRLPTGHMLVHPLVDGTDVGWFIFDSAADSMCIDTRAADRLKLPVFGKVGTGGSGGSEFFRLRRGRSFQLGPVAVNGFTYLELDLAPYEPIAGVPLGGVVGYDLIARVVAEMDFANERIALYDPSEYTLGDGKWHDFVFCSRSPTIRATFEGDREGLFAIDTAGSGTVGFHTSAQTQLRPLIERAGGVGSRSGVGGAQPTVTGPLAWLAIGDQRFEALTVSFSRATEGWYTEPYLTGTIGGKLFAGHILTFDYANQRLALARSKSR